MGAGRAILFVAADDVHQDIEPLAVARILKAVVDAEAPKLVIVGKQAIDNDMTAMGQMLAAPLGWGQATCASRLEIDGDTAKVTREADGGLQMNGPNTTALDQDEPFPEGFTLGDTWG